MENGEGCEMGGTSREGFLVPTSRRHFQDSDKNVNVISEDNYKAAHIIKYGDDKTKHLADRGVRAGDGDNDRVLTDKIIYDVRPTEGKHQEEIGESQESNYTPHVQSGQ